VIAEKIDLKKIAADYKNKVLPIKRRVIICAGTGCVANGALEIHDALVKEVENRKLNVVVELDKHDCGTSDVFVSKSGCQGFCQAGPLVTVEPEGYLYVHVKVDDVKEIVDETLVNNRLVERLVYREPGTDTKHAKTSEIPFYAKQNRFVLGQCGFLDPESIDEYIANEGYWAAEKAYASMTPENICQVVFDSGLRGRGGGGFSTGRKWQFALAQDNDKKYVICNGDEGDPGAFMDRSLMEGNPHRVIEGIIIAARAIGADEAFIYVRTEYPLAVKRIRKAVRDAESYGILGKDIFGSGYNIKCNVMEGAGAFVCGEETALIASIEGKRGMPMPKPPFPAQKGLLGKPTVINNVETLATVPLIISKGKDAFRKLGTEKSPGTKTFALTGYVANTGLIEVPFGTTLRKIIFDIGGGVTDKLGNIIENGFKAVQIGGPSGGCLTEEHLDLPLDFDSAKSIGAMIGSGGLVVMNKETCMVQVAHFFMRFTQKESCGKCVPCREGTKQMLNLLDDVQQGKANAATLDLLQDLAGAVSKGSLCGLGKTAPNPIFSTLKYFRKEYEAHVLHGHCPAGKCKAFALPEILAELCKGCTACKRKCPVGAISGEKGKPHKIDADKCIKCGSCVAACKFSAIIGI
jgi:NADH-quinone oxidoreductase subunit F